MLEFLCSLLLAILAGQVNISQASSMTSEDINPNESTRIEWLCGTFDVETCFIEFDNDGVRTGP